jgi:hypothetical protein
VIGLVLALVLAAITISAQVVSIITGLLLPVLVAGVTKLNASETVKATAGLVLAAAAALIVQATQADGSAVITGSLLLTFAFVWVPQIASYYGWWKPAVKINERIFPSVGIGPKEGS